MSSLHAALSQNARVARGKLSAGVRPRVHQAVRDKSLRSLRAETEALPQSRTQVDSVLNSNSSSSELGSSGEPSAEQFVSAAPARERVSDSQSGQSEESNLASESTSPAPLNEDTTSGADEEPSSAPAASQVDSTVVAAASNGDASQEETPSTSSSEANITTPVAEDGTSVPESAGKTEGDSSPEEPSSVVPNPTESEKASAQDAQVFVSRDEFPYKVGEDVVGRVRWSNNRGARIDIKGYESVQGFMPRNRGPYALRSAFAPNPYVNGSFGEEGCIAAGVVRKFRVVAVPSDMAVGGKGPLLAANNVDQALIWRRLHQIRDIGKRMRETIRVEVHGAVDRGLLCQLSGMRGFIPVSHIPKPKDAWYGRDELQELFVGKEVVVSLMEVTPEKQSFTASIINAQSDDMLRKMLIGSLVWGSVRRITAYGAFISLDGTYESALLHIANVSWDRVEAMEDIFREGDRVRAVVIGMDEGFTRISVSTRDIEGSEGDMLRDPHKVYEGAEENVQRFLQHVAQWEAEEAAQTAAADGAA